MNLIYNGDCTFLPPEPRVDTTTGDRYINGKAGGAFNNNGGWGWFGKDYGLHGSAIGYVVGVGHDGTNGIRLSNTTETGKSSAISLNQPAEPYTVYRLTGHVNLTNVPVDGAYMKVNLWPAGAAQANATAVTAKFSGTAHCRDIDLTFTTIGSTAQINVEAHNIVPGAISDVTFHNLRIEKVEVAVTPNFGGNTEFGYNAPFDVAGTSWVVADLNKYFDRAVEMGCKHIRASFFYGYIHSLGSTGYNYTIFDTFIQLANAKGLEVMPLISFPPAALGTTEFTDYFTNVAAHFKNLGVTYYELWNEKNFLTQYNLDNTPETYAELMKAVYPAMKLGDPECKVMFSGLMTGIDPSPTVYPTAEFLDRFYLAGAGNCYDGVCLHPYNQLDAVVQGTLSVMKAHGDEYKPMFFTEDGIPTGGKSNEIFTDQAGQAVYISNSIDFARKYGVKRLYFHNGCDTIPKQPGKEGYYGLLSGPLSNLVPKQAFNVAKAKIVV